MERIQLLLGANVDRDAMIAGLERLGLSVEASADVLEVTAPTWRPDLTMEDDIAEEVGRIALGYENLPETLPPQRAGRGQDSTRGAWMGRVRESLVRAGLQEVVSHSLTAPSALSTEEETARRVAIRSALSEDVSTLRTSLTPNLAAIAARAHTSGQRDIALFEVGPVYRKADVGDGYVEPLRVTGIVTGSAVGQPWAIKPETLPADFFYIKGIVESLLTTLGIPTPSLLREPIPIPIRAAPPPSPWAANSWA